MQDGSWWCVLATPGGNRIHELVGSQWVPLDSPDALLGEPEARADVLWTGRSLIVLLFGPHSHLSELSYDAARRDYALRPGFPVDLPLPTSSETAVVARDSQDRLWITWAADQQVSVTHSQPDHRHWSFPAQVLEDSVGADEISTVMSFGGDAIGVAWSDQRRSRFGFRMRHDRDDPQLWGETEIIAAGDRVADDHLNAAVDRQGNVYLASKNGRHELSVHRRDPSGHWSTAVDVMQGGHGTRPVIMVSEDTAFLLYTRWHAGLEIVAYRRSPLDALDFSSELPLIVLLGEDVRLTDVTGTKQVLPDTTLIAMAQESGRAWWNGWGAGISPHRSRTSSMSLDVTTVERTDDAVLALSFDEETGCATFDASPASNRAVLGGEAAADMSEPERIAGRSGSALRFDGYRQYVAVADAPRLTPTGSFTLEAWVRRFSVWQNNVVVGKGAPGARTMQLRIDKQNRIEFLRDVVAGGHKHRVRSHTTIADSLWHHIACVVDLEARQTRVYLDGVRVAAAPDSGITVHTESTLYIGAREYKDTLREWWRGDIDQLRLSDGARYDADFVPPVRFPSVGSALFLSWAPPVHGPDVPQAYEVLRRRAGGALESLFDVPLRATQIVDLPGRPGQLTYRVRPVSSPWPAPADRQVQWLPATAPAVPAVADTAMASRR
jgi:hypothetical protein